jgi:hypothetical protein
VEGTLGLVGHAATFLVSAVPKQPKASAAEDPFCSEHSFLQFCCPSPLPHVFFVFHMLNLSQSHAIDVPFQAPDDFLCLMPN